MREKSTEVVTLSEEPFKEVILTTFNLALCKQDGFHIFWREIRNAVTQKFPHALSQDEISISDTSFFHLIDITLLFERLLPICGTSPI